jgi:hypothetical protein
MSGQRIVKEYIEKGNAPGGLIELAEDTNLVAALQITDDEFRTLASIALPASVDRDGYVQLLMTVRAITKACRWMNSFPFLKRAFILLMLSRIAYLVVPRRLRGERCLRRFLTNRTRAASVEATCSKNANWTSTIFVAWPPSYSPTASIFMPTCCWQNWLI